MAIGDLLLQRQMMETDKRLSEKTGAEDRRRRRTAGWQGLTTTLGGIGGGLLGLALAPVTGGASLAVAAGLGGAAGSYGGSLLGQQWAGGREAQATGLGKNINVLTGEQKEYSEGVKRRFKKDISDYQDDMKTSMRNKAISTGIRSAAFAWANPAMATKAANWGKSALGMEQIGALQPAVANIAGAQAYDPFSGPGYTSKALTGDPGLTKLTGSQLKPNNMLNIATDPVSNAPVLTPDPTAGLTGATTQASPVGGVINNNLVNPVPSNIGARTTPALSGHTFGGNINMVPQIQGRGLQPWQVGYNPQSITVGNAAGNPLYGSALQAYNQLPQSQPYWNNPSFIGPTYP